MLKKCIFILLYVVLFLSCNNSLSGSENNGCSSQTQTENDAEETLVRQSLDYSDSNQIIYNPDMGFYSAIDICVEQNGVLNKSSVLSHISETAAGFSGTYDDNAVFNLLHLKFDLSAFSSNAIRNINKEGEVGNVTSGVTGELTAAALNDINEILGAVEEAGKTSIVRFCYDYRYQGQKKYADSNNQEIRDNLIWVSNDGTDNAGYKLLLNQWGNPVYADVEPAPGDFETVLSHIQSITPLLIANQKSITAIECGMIGPYGEMHSTTLAGPATINGNEVEDGYIIQVMHKFLTGLGNTELPFLVRQPKFIRNYLAYYGDTYKSKLGMYNDGYLGSDTDLGTFDNGSTARRNDIEYLEQFTSKTPYGGEMCHDYGDSNHPALWREASLESSVNEMFSVHLSFLNIAWNDTVLAWADSANHSFGGISDNNIVRGERFFQYLIKHMGYRYLLTDSVFKYPENKASLTAELKFENKGFANIPYHRKKSMSVIFEKDGNVVMERTVSGQTFDGSDKALTVDTSSLASGSYLVYLKVSDSDGAYPIRLANNLWKEELKANKIGSFTK